MQRHKAVLVGWAVGAMLAVPSGAPVISAAPEPDTLAYALVLTGTELLEGIYADAHTQFITSTLRPLGARCVTVVMARDQREDLRRSLEFARSQAALVVVTGGLGPTDADLTRQVLAEFTGMRLREDRTLLERLERRFGRSARDLSPGVRRQAQVPESGSYLVNLEGTAAGLVFECPDWVLVALPGPPEELRPMVTEALVPYLTRRFRLRPPGTAVTLRFVGIGESAITDVLHQQLSVPADVITSFQFDAGRVDLTLALPGDAPEDRRLLEELQTALVERLGQYIYARDATSLEGRVLELLAERGMTLGVAEVGTAGAVAQALMENAGDTDRVKGALVAASHAQLEALLALPVTERLERWPPGDSASAEKAADRVAKILGAGSGLAVMAAFRENGGSFLWVAAGSKEAGFSTRRISVREGRGGRGRMVTEILDFVRRTLEKPAGGG
ncbi:MAG: competence/damage-inducible protein A [Acidobacteriota bacterium]